MTKLSKMTEFKIAGPRKETVLDKTTRIVRKINDENNEIRNDKTARLRRDRFKDKTTEPVKATAQTFG